MNSVVQREVLEWFKLWKSISCTRDQLVNLNRGPFRDFQLNFLLPLARSDDYIETFRTNLYLQEADVNADGEFMEKEVTTALFAAKLNKLKQLEEESRQIQSQVNSKQEALQHMRIEKSTSTYRFKLDYYRILDERVQRTSEMVTECDQAASSLTNRESSNSSQITKGANLPVLADAAHLAFQSVVMRHYLYAENSPRLEGSLTADEFNALVLAVINEDSYGLKAFQWVEKERNNCLKSCEEFIRKLVIQDKQCGLQQSMGDKMKDIIMSWSTAHVQAFFKNNSREKLLSEAKADLQNKQRTNVAEANNSFRLSDFFGLLRRKYLAAKVERCRQHNNQSNHPLENIFRNISTDHFSTPTPEDDIDNMFVNLRRQSNMKEWVLALSDYEQIQEIYTVLLKTWKNAKRNLVDMMSFAQQPSNELLQNFLQTAECIKVTFPKPLSTRPVESHRTRTVSENHSALSGSLLSVTSSISTLEITSGSLANLNPSDSLSESRVSGETSSEDLQDLSDLCEQIPLVDVSESTTKIQQLIRNLNF